MGGPHYCLLRAHLTQRVGGAGRLCREHSLSSVVFRGRTTVLTPQLPRRAERAFQNDMTSQLTVSCRPTFLDLQLRVRVTHKEQELERQAENWTRDLEPKS